MDFGGGRSLVVSLFRRPRIGADEMRRVMFIGPMAATCRLFYSSLQRPSDLSTFMSSAEPGDGSSLQHARLPLIVCH
jgi:hypothetical protein